MGDGRAGARPRRRTAAAAAAAIALAALAGCRRDDTAAPAPPTVTVARPTVGEVADSLDFTGTTAASDSVTLVARVEGYLEAVHFTDGAAVKQGDLLFTVQQSQYRAQLQQAEAQVAAQKAALVHAETELARYRGLVKEESAPQTEVDRWQYERDSAAAGLLGAQAQVEIAKLNLSYTRIAAPFDGRMGRHLVDPGNVVGAMGQPTSLAVIDQTDPLYVYFTIDERDLLRIRARHRDESRRNVTAATIPVAFGLLDEEGYPHPGHLDFAALGVAPTTGTLQARGIFPNPGPGVLPGLFVRVRVDAGAPHSAVLVPGVALSFDQQGEYVLVVNAQNVVERRPVSTGQQVGERFVIEEGLTADDWVITEGLSRAVPGRAVTPDRAAAASAAQGSGDAPPAGGAAASPGAHATPPAGP